LQVLGISAAITAGIQLTGFVVAFALQTEIFYDVLGGINFLSIAIYSAIDGQYENNAFFSSPRKVSFTAIFLLSRTWLLLFLAWRAHERGGDSRFDEIKPKFFSFLVAWVFQGVWVFTISLPLMLVNGSDKFNNGDGNGFSINEYMSIIFFALGVLLEITADIQKAKWVKNGRIGTFCKTGVWSQSRHPNYFGEISQWFSAWTFAFGSGTGFTDIQWWISILSPIMTIVILLFTPATGVYNANGKNLKRYYDACPEEYTKYRKETSILVPLPCGLYKYVPMILKRTVLLDFKMYEYTPADNGSGNDNGDGNISYSNIDDATEDERKK